MQSMRWDLDKEVYASQEEYLAYIYGSADVVGLMCLKVFVKGDEQKYQALKPAAMALGSAFQKVNFLRDLNADFDLLNRNYFKLLSKLKNTPSRNIKNTRIRVPNYQKMGVLAQSYVKFRLNLL
ncbi:MAG: squalene/phytoene synthase family protein, partial [Flavobacteriaceae bacterium]